MSPREQPPVRASRRLECPSTMISSRPIPRRRGSRISRLAASFRQGRISETGRGGYTEALPPSVTPPVVAQPAHEAGHEARSGAPLVIPSAHARSIARRRRGPAPRAGRRRRQRPVPHARRSVPGPAFASRADWDARAAYLREHVLASAGLLPLPERTPLNPSIFGEVRARRLRRVEGVLREPAGVLRHRQPLPSRRQGPVSGGALGPRPLDLRAVREQRPRLRAGARDHPRAPWASSSSRTT